MSALEELGNANKFLGKLDQGIKAFGRLTSGSAKTAAQIGGWGTMSDTENARIERANRRMHGDANRAGTYEEMTGRQYDAVRNGAEPRYNPYSFRYRPEQAPPYQRPGTVYPAGLPASPEANDLAVITNVVKDLQLMNNSASAPSEVLVEAAAEIKDKLAGLTYGKSAIRIGADVTLPIGGNINITIPAGYYSPATLAQALETLVGVDPKVKAALDAQFAQTAAAPARSEPAPAATPATTTQAPAPAKVETAVAGVDLQNLTKEQKQQIQLAMEQAGFGTGQKHGYKNGMAANQMDGVVGPETMKSFVKLAEKSGMDVTQVAAVLLSGDHDKIAALTSKLDKVAVNAPTSPPPAQAEAAPSVTFPSPTATDLGLAQHGVTTPAAPLTGVAATPVAGEAPPSFLTALGISGVTPAPQGVYTGNVSLPLSPAPDTAALDARVGEYAKEVGLVANTGGGNALFTAAAPAFADTASQAQALAASVSAPAVAAPAVAVARGVEAAAPEALAAYFEPPPPQGLPNHRGASQGMGGIV